MTLIVLDPKGLLYKRIDLSDDRLEYVRGENCLVFPKFRLLFREGTRDFLEFLYNRYTVGFYSSEPKKKLKKILQVLLTPEQYIRTLFIWGEERLRMEPGIFEFKTYKSLIDVLENPEINCKREWNYNNVLFCDTQVSKVNKIPSENLISVKSFSGSPYDLSLYDLIGEIPKKLPQDPSHSVLDGLITF